MTTLHRHDGKVLKDNTEAERKYEIEDPYRVHLVREYGLPPEPNRERRNREREPLGEYVTDHAAGAAMPNRCRGFP